MEILFSLTNSDWCEQRAPGAECEHLPIAVLFLSEFFSSFSGYRGFYPFFLLLLKIGFFV